MKYVYTKKTLGTQFEISIVDSRAESFVKEIVESAFDEIDRIEKTYSRFLKESDLSQFNANPDSFEMSDEFKMLTHFGKEVEKNSDGAFNIRVGQSLNKVGYSGALNEGDVDLGGLGKGYAIDRVFEILKREFDNFFIDGGGDMRSIGSDENENWKIFFGHPANLQQVIGEYSVPVSGIAFAASNPLYRTFEKGHHLINPKTGKSASDMMAVYTQASSAIIADAYSTALFAMGYREACEKIKTLPLEAMLVSTQGSVFVSDDFKGEFYTT